MKHILVCIALLGLLLVGCGETQTADTTASIPASATAGTPTPAASPLVGVWVNAGQYADGHDFVETMTLAADGTATVHLEYQGADYATLTGVWTEESGVLNVDFTDPNTRDRSYAYTVTETALTLTGEGKDVTYQRQE